MGASFVYNTSSGTYEGTGGEVFYQMFTNRTGTCFRTSVKGQNSQVVL